MPSPSLMYMHYVMEAQEHFREAKEEISALRKLDRLAAALESLNIARECGAPPATILKMQMRYYQEFFEIVKQEDFPSA
jgi:hypothetical protein